MPGKSAVVERVKQSVNYRVIVTIIKGERDSTNRLFYITFDGPKVKAASVAAAAVETHNYN